VVSDNDVEFPEHREKTRFDGLNFLSSITTTKRVKGQQQRQRVLVTIMASRRVVILVINLMEHIVHLNIENIQSIPTARSGLSKQIQNPPLY
jgi:hypothetical protein